MNFLHAIILGIVQGITEWLPISSSGHLVLVEHLLGIEQPVAFAVMLHLASLLVVLFFFRKDIFAIALGVFRGEKYQIKTLVQLFIASVPLAIIGFVFGDFIKILFSDIRTVGFSLLFTSAVLFLSKYPSEKQGGITYYTAIVMGIAQAIAILPGVSRSGLAISSGMLMGKDRRKVATFAFLMFIPAIIGAGLYEAKDISAITDISAMLVGSIVAIIVGFFALKLLMKLIEKNRFSYFSAYCFLLGLGILFFTYIV